LPAADTHFPDLDAADSWRSASDPTRHADNGYDYQIERWS